MEHMVIFDTNAYRGLSWGGLAKVKALERKNGFVAKANPIVLLELVTHLLDDDEEARICAKALAKLIQHVTPDGTDGKPRLINGPATIVTHALWGRRIVDEDQAKSELARVALCLGPEGKNNLDASSKAIVERAIKGKTLDEVGWIAHHQKLSKIDPASDAFRAKWAEEMITTYSVIAGITLSRDENLRWSV